MLLRRLLLVPASVLSFAAGCGGAPDETTTASSTDGSAPDMTAPAPTTGSEPSPAVAPTSFSRSLALIDRSPLEDCASGLSTAQVDEQLQIAVALHDSIHELVACGGMTITIAATLIGGIANAIIAGTTSFAPEGMRYEGEGRYVAPTGLGGEGTLTVRFWEQGAEGAVLIEDDLFDLDSYLEGARISSGVDANGVWLGISFDRPGPWVELLGWGENPSSPVRLSGNDLLALSPDLNGILVSSDVLVDDREGSSVVSYSVQSEPQPLDEVVYVGNIDYELLGISAKNSHTEQGADAEAIDWDIAFGQAALTGSAAFRIEGGPFDYDLFYGHSPDHSDDIVVNCAER